MMGSKSRRKFLCVDCGIDTGKIHEHYFIKTELWLTVMPTIEGMLCIGCLEKRLGRRLSKKDFTDARINDPYYGAKSQRLISRLIALRRK
ncbi:MAG: hypothetical protein Q7R79_04590 [bacterium]|nr:hypothetical protein [bacterium]